MLDFLIAICIAAPFFFFFLYVLPGAYDMYQNRNYHSWPSVARCRLCDKRIFAWQRHERRAFDADVENPQRVMVFISVSCLMHKSCKGHPASHVQIMVGVKQTIHSQAR